MSQNPEESYLKEEKLRIKTPPQSAGGLKAIAASLKHIRSEMGTFKGVSALMKMNQTDGFDCPGCAWPDPDDKRALGTEFCENGAKALAEEATNKRVDPAFFEKYSVAQLAEASDFWLGKQGRLTHPMILKADQNHYEAITWKAAFEKIADSLNALNSPNEAIFYTSGRTSNEAAFLYQLMVRRFGTNNLPDCSNMCHESSGQGLSQTVGIGKGSVTLEDLHQAEVIMVVGQNPGTNHPRMLSALQQCKKNGGKIISVNPLPEAGLMHFQHPQKPADLLGGGTSLTDLFLQVKVNGDIALAKALMKHLLHAEEKNPGKVLDLDFIAEYTDGFEALKKDLNSHDIQQLAEDCGISEENIEAAADLLIAHDKIIICWAMGLTQHKNGVENIREMVNILLMKGSIGKEGAGTCPVRGHSNVQGDRTMGIWEKPKKAFLDALEKEFGFDPPREHGLDTVHAIEAMLEGKGKVFLAMGGNFLSASPDTYQTAEALRNCDLTVQVSTKLNRSHLITGKEAIILPCIARSEEDRQATGLQFVSMENSMGIVHASTGSLSPASSHLKSEPAIVAGLAEKLFEGDPDIDWAGLVSDYDRIRDKIENCIPGFDRYNERVRKEGGFYLPNGARERKFNTSDGKAHFTLNPLPNESLLPGQLILMTIRSHDQYNTTLYGLDDRYRGIYQARRVLLMNADDMAERGLAAEQLVHIRSYYEEEVREAKHFRVVPYSIPKGCTAAYFPEANVLVPLKSRAKGSNTPSSKWVVISVEAS